jgi:AcrR family transcriptional regulator
MGASAPQMPALLGQCAFECFAEHGFGKVNLDQIAARAGVTKGSLYWHYKNKKQLILAACNHYYAQWFQCVHAELATVVDPGERIRSVVEYSVKSCVIDRKNRVFTTGIFVLMQEDPEVKAGWMQFYNSVREFYVGLLAAVIASGQLETGDPRASVDLMLEAIEGIKLRATFERHIAESAEQEKLVEGLMGILES